MRRARDFVELFSNIGRGFRVHRFELAWALPADTAPSRPLRMSGDGDSGDPMGAAEKRAVPAWKELDDHELVDRVMRGEQGAYSVLVERYQGRIFAVAYGVLHHREDAREVTQDAFIKAYRNLPGFRSDASFYTWMYRIAVNLAIDLKRRAHRTRETTFEDIKLSPDEVYVTGPRILGTPAEQLEEKQLSGKIREAIDQLPDEQRTAIILREVHGLSYKEIADTMGCAEGTVMSRLFYARKKLQEMLREAR
jgi:RNA polymerase sigma-70 factor (ECF subfamily)